MLDKLVETWFATVAGNEEKSFLPLFWFFGLWVVVHKFQLLLFPSSPMPDSRMQITFRIISIAIISSLQNTFLLDRAYLLLTYARACLGSPPPRGSYLFLDKKVTKNQGLHLFFMRLYYFIGIKDCCAILELSYRNSYCGNMEVPKKNRDRILPWAVGCGRFVQEFQCLFLRKSAMPDMSRSQIA